MGSVRFLIAIGMAFGLVTLGMSYPWYTEPEEYPTESFQHSCTSNFAPFLQGEERNDTGAFSLKNVFTRNRWCNVVSVI